MMYINKRLVRCNSIILITLSFLLMGCISQHNYVPQDLIVPGDYQLPESNLIFPENVEGFHRVSITQFNDQQTHIGVGYNNDEKLIALTIFISPEPTLRSFGSPKNVIESAHQYLFEDTFQRSKEEILYAHQNSELVIEEPYQIKAYSPTYGMHAEFTYKELFAGQYQAVVSHLYLMKVEQQLFKYRVTYPESMDNEAIISKIISRIPQQRP